MTALDMLLLGWTLLNLLALVVVVSRPKLVVRPAVVDRYGNQADPFAASLWEPEAAR